MIRRPTFAVVLETRTPRKDNLFPVKLRVTYFRKQRYISLGRYLSADDWKKANAPGAKGVYQELKIEFAAIERRALEICEAMPVFSFDLFREAWQGRRPMQGGVIEMLREKSVELHAFGQVRTARLYEATARILEIYMKKKRISFEQVRPDFLKKFERWMEQRGNSVSTRSIYLRNIQHAFNRAIDAGIVSAELYPFGRKGFRIQKARTMKRAISLEDLEKIFAYSPENETEGFYRDFWILLYLTAANVKDILRLKFRDIEDGRIVFYRAKTLNDRSHTLKPVVVVIGKHEKRIIEKKFVIVVCFAYFCT